MERYLVKGYTKTGIYSDIVYANSEEDAVKSGSKKIKAAFPDRKFVKFVAETDD